MTREEQLHTAVALLRTAMSNVDGAFSIDITKVDGETQVVVKFNRIVGNQLLRQHFEIPSHRFSEKTDKPIIGTEILIVEEQFHRFTKEWAINNSIQETNPDVQA